MNSWKDNFLKFLKNKLYVLTLLLTALCSYGFLITHQTVGIDDTPYAYYFEEGLIAIVGRWVLYLLNKIFHISDFSPFMMDFIAVLILAVAATVWCTLLYSVMKDRLPIGGYAVFACFFIANPLLSEVFTYYLHNGVAIGYLCSGISLCFLKNGLDKIKERLSKGIVSLTAAALFLWISIGCYESFMIVWLLGVLLLLLTERIAEIKRNVFVSLFVAAVTAMVGVLLRSIMIVAVTKLFGLEYLQGEAVQRSIAEMLSWMLEAGSRAEFHMALKRFFVMYGVFAYAYYPIFIFVLAAVVIGFYAIWKSIRKRDLWIFVLMVGCFLTPILLVVIEGKVTLYRSAQFLPVICAYGAWVFVYAIWNATNALKGQKPQIVGKSIRGIAAIGLFVLIFNQCSEMNKWFYVDSLKYEDAKNTMNQIAYELERDFDTSKPIVFTGIYEVPRTIIEDAYVPYGSPVFYKMKKITDVVDEHLLEKFYRDYGVWVAQTPSLSVIDWGRYAFDTDEEMARFFAMHGHTIQPHPDKEIYAVAEEYAVDMPDYPAKGSVVDVGDYIIVNL